MSSILKQFAAIMTLILLPICVQAHGDAELLDLLENKGIIAPSEASVLRRQSAEVVMQSVAPQSEIAISAKMQTQYAYINADCIDGIVQNNNSTINRFLVRRMILTFESKVERDWGTKLSFDFILSNKLSITYIWKRIDSDWLKGEFRMGYLKPNFCFEENMSPFDLYCVERSIATYYWGGPRNARRLGFGSFMTGAYWYGSGLSDKNLKYGFGVSNSENFKLGLNQFHSGKDNAPNLWASASYKLSAEKCSLVLGINSGWGADANKTAQNNPASIFGLNPYFSFSRGNTRACAEYLFSGVDDGKVLGGGYRAQFPMGMNFLAEHKFDIGDAGKLAPVFRFTFLDTDGRGLTPADGLRQCPTVGGDIAYSRARGYYFGVNWYLNENYLKVQAGYEFSQFAGGHEQTHSLDANSARMQIQVLF